MNLSIYGFKKYIILIENRFDHGIVYHFAQVKFINELVMTWIDNKLQHSKFI